MKKRRQFFKTAIGAGMAGLLPASLLAHTQEKKPPPHTLRPKALKRGDTIGLIAPGYAIKPEILMEAKETLEKIGFIPYHTDRIHGNHGYFSNTDGERATDLNEMFANKNVDGILCARGGYGCTRIMHLIDYGLIGKNPKALIGFSDITALLNGIHQETGLITFHGPVGSTINDPYSIGHLLNVVMNSKKLPPPITNIEITDQEEYSKPEYGRYCINPGIVSGKLVGGSLTLVNALIGTPHEIDFTDALVFLEDVEEAPYRIDRMLTQLIQGKTFGKAAGIVLGVFNGCDSVPGPESFTLKEVVQDRIKPLGIPAVYGMTFGHIENNFTLPIGIKARLDTHQMTLQLLEKAVQ
ncbi:MULTISPECIES: LD-carboxypeptidase [unclassified Arenibacter]|jgi:muramoyltetrapeptide carboxypeptidase|uniref:S66 peptidase family protein n=1 Tax=unclassified Arenibacter TaxID=2615047 RepID=UPI000E34ABAF|nr:MULTISPECIES: LD-carboxypeptidase [unclassified Arenibacter]MCM4165251.1 LD-carboxypeptidase [Arenibacter sp. A80]RFT55211.1 LD-carboxypeptidase [Arenibacter sp. P308M17]